MAFSTSKGLRVGFWETLMVGTTPAALVHVGSSLS